MPKRQARRNAITIVAAAIGNAIFEPRRAHPPGAVHGPSGVKAALGRRRERSAQAGRDLIMA